ncbi:MAG: hypothetical protein E2O77_03690 [Caldithrix sp.]|nr:MAG: hypothetical protein E2O77_03690 [Caldithrix sp.]
MSLIPSLLETQLITGEELLEMPGIGSCERVEGRIVPMSPTGGEQGFIEATIVRIALARFTDLKLMCKC